MEGSDLTDIADRILDKVLADLQFAVITSDALDEIVAFAAAGSAEFSIDKFIRKHDSHSQKVDGARAFDALTVYLKRARGLELDDKAHADVRDALTRLSPGEQFWIFDESLPSHRSLLDPANYSGDDLDTYYRHELAESLGPVWPGFGDRMLEVLERAHDHLGRVRAGTVLIVAGKRQRRPAPTTTPAIEHSASGLSLAIAFGFLAIALAPRFLDLGAWDRVLLAIGLGGLLVGLGFGIRDARRYEDADLAFFNAMMLFMFGLLSVLPDE